MRWNWLPLGLLMIGPLGGQTPVFEEQTGLLSNSGNGTTSFSSGIPMGVVDMNGDRKDDIVRFHDARHFNIEYQTTPGGAFAHYYGGQLVTFPSLWSMTAADVDENGYTDLVVGDIVTNQGHDLLLANADGTAFTTSALGPPVKLSQGVIFADLDNDGLLDVFGCDDIDDNHKWKNNGGGSFTLMDSLLPTLLTPALANEGNYAIVGTDYDDDGDVDYYLSKCRAGDFSSTSLRRINRMFRNNGDGTFTDLSGAAGLDSGDQTWAADFADIDNDGDVDCFLMNHQDGSSGASQMFENDGTGAFTDVTVASGMSGQVGFHGIQCVFRDFNNDGWIDLLVGAVSTLSYGYYQNDGDGTFTKVSNVLKFSNNANVPGIHSFAVGDLNGDGHLDLYAGRANSLGTPSNSRDLMFFNQGNSNSYLSLTLVGDASNIHGVGARVEAIGPWGTQVREVRGGESYGIVNSYNVHFGLGTETEVTQLVVRWPSGTVDTIDVVPGDRSVSVFEGTGAVAMSFADWIADCFPGGGLDAEADEDPDGDGVENLVEQVLGTDPKVPSGGSGLVATVEEDGGQDYFRVSVDRVPVQDVELSVSFSTDGGTWVVPSGLEVVEDTQTSFVVRVPVDLAAEPFMMARLEVDFVTP